jgi:DNA-binding MarR family transcriptional regulator
MTIPALCKIFSKAGCDRRMTVRMLAILTYLSISGPVQFSEVAAGVGIQKAALSRASGMLGVLKFITRTREENDHRMVIVCLTDKGRAYIKELCA